MLCLGLLPRSASVINRDNPLRHFYCRINILSCKNTPFLRHLQIFAHFSSFSLRQPLILLEEAGDAIGFGETFDGETVGGHDGAVVVLMGTTQFGGHGHFVVEVSQGTVGIEGTGVEDGLRCLLDPCLLLWGWIGPGEVIVDDILGVTIIALQSSADCTHPCHVDV